MIGQGDPRTQLARHAHKLARSAVRLVQIQAADGVVYVYTEER